MVEMHFRLTIQSSRNQNWFLQKQKRLKNVWTSSLTMSTLINDTVGYLIDQLWNNLCFIWQDSGGNSQPFILTFVANSNTFCGFNCFIGNYFFQETHTRDFGFFGKTTETKLKASRSAPAFDPQLTCEPAAVVSAAQAVKRKQTAPFISPFENITTHLVGARCAADPPELGSSLGSSVLTSSHSFQAKLQRQWNIVQIWLKTAFITQTPQSLRLVILLFKTERLKLHSNLIRTDWQRCELLSVRQWEKKKSVSDFSGGESFTSPAVLLTRGQPLSSAPPSSGLLMRCRFLFGSENLSASSFLRWVSALHFN